MVSAAVGSGAEESLSSLLKVVGDPNAAAKVLADLKKAEDAMAELRVVSRENERKEKGLQALTAQLAEREENLAARDGELSKREHQYLEAHEALTEAKAAHEARVKEHAEEHAERSSALVAREAEVAALERRASAKHDEYHSAIERLRAVVG